MAKYQEAQARPRNRKAAVIIASVVGVFLCCICVPVVVLWFTGDRLYAGLLTLVQ